MKIKRFFASLLVFSLFISLVACSNLSNFEKCKACGEEYTEGMQYCPSCGNKIAKDTFCPNGHKNEAGAKFCQECGTTLTNNEENNDEDNKEDNNTQKIWLRVKSIPNELSYATQYYYNSSGQLVAEKAYYKSNNIVFSIVNYSYDEYGNLILRETTNISSDTTTSTFSVTYNNKYDENGKLISVTDSRSTVTEYKYDSTGNLSEKTYHYAEDSAKNREVYENGKIKATYLEDNILYEEYFYDANGRLEKCITYVTYWFFNSGNDTAYSVFLGKRDNADEIPDEAKDRTTVELVENVTTYIYDGNDNIIYEQTVGSYDNKTISHRYLSLAEYCAQGLDDVLPESNTNKEKCGSCTNGYNTCGRCEGTGKVLTGFDNPKYKLCGGCGGSCYVQCDHCHGDGYIVIITGK